MQMNQATTPKYPDIPLFKDGCIRYPSKDGESSEWFGSEEEREFTLTSRDEKRKLELADGAEDWNAFWDTLHNTQTGKQFLHRHIWYTALHDNKHWNILTIPEENIHHPAVKEVRKYVTHLFSIFQGMKEEETGMK
jgi:hypothetical protein